MMETRRPSAERDMNNFLQYIIIDFRILSLYAEHPGVVAATTRT